MCHAVPLDLVASDALFVRFLQPVGGGGEPVGHEGVHDGAQEDQGADQVEGLRAHPPRKRGPDARRLAVAVQRAREGRGHRFGGKALWTQDDRKEGEAQHGEHDARPDQPQLPVGSL
jgi:hypothetical protein